MTATITPGIATSGPGTLVWGLDRLPEDLVGAVGGTGGTVEHGCGEPLVELVRSSLLTSNRSIGRTHGRSACGCRESCHGV